jgi:type II secretory pathway predicted ATPase ExeA
MKKNNVLFFCPVLIAPLASSSSGVVFLKLQYNRPFFARTIPLEILTVLFVLFLVAAAWLFYLWQRSRYVFCPECSALNSKNNKVCVKCGARIKQPPLTEEQKKWFGTFHWTKNPFILNTIPDTHVDRNAEILLIIEKLNTLSGHILIIGGIGSGKTILLHWLEKHLKDKYETIYVPQPPDDPDEFIDLVLSSITKKTLPRGKNTDPYKFYELCKRSQKKILILLDKAQESREIFKRFMSTLANIPNVFLIMAGDPEAREMIKHDLPDFFDRIVETIFLGALTRGETEELIIKRINDAGGKGPAPFTPQAIDEIFSLSYGIPLKILRICDWAVANAVRDNKETIDGPDIKAYIPGKQGG